MKVHEDYSKTNKELLSQFRPELRLNIGNTLPDGIEPLKSKSGGITIKYNGTLVHSRFNPEDEGRKFAQSGNLKQGDIVICYGFGLGYHVEAILDAVGESGKCYVIELNQDLLKAGMILRDLSRLIKADRLVILTGDEEKEVAGKCSAVLSDSNMESGGTSTRILVHAASFKHIPKKYETIQNFFEVMLMERAVPQVFRRLSYANINRNLDDVLAWPGIEQVAPAFKGCPAFLISAGPSLDDALPHLKGYQDRAWIFCVDTSLSALINAGIRPDFVASVDPQDDSLQHFRGYANCEVPLLFIPTANESVISSYKGRKAVIIQSGHSIVSKIEHLLSRKGTVNAGGSAACILLEAIVKYGANPVIFAGQDCGFPDMKVYSSNINWTRQMLSSTSRFSTLEMKHRGVANSHKLIKLKNKFGQDIPSHQNLYSYLREIERIVETYPGTGFYNFLSKGAAIKGVKEIYFIEELESMLKDRRDKHVEIHRGIVDEEKKREILKILDEK